MSSSPERNPGWIDDFPDIPEASVLLPWMLAGLMLCLCGIYLVLTPIKPGKSLPSPGPSVSQAPSPTRSHDAVDLSHLSLVLVDSADSSFGYAADLFARQVDKLSSARMKVQVHTGGNVDGQALDELHLAQLVESGQAQLGIITSTLLVSFNPRFEVLDLPFLFETLDQADHVLDGPVGREILDGLEPSGLKGLCFMELGFRIFSSSTPLRNLEDFKGKKLRVMQSTTSLRFTEVLKAEGVPTPVNKIKDAARAGFIDAADRTYPTYWDFQLYEVHHHLTDTRHSYSVKVLLANKAFYEGLSEQDRRVIQEAAQEVHLAQRKRGREEDRAVQEKCKQAGIEIIELNDKERARWKVVCEPLYDEYGKLHGPALLDKIRAGVKGSE